MRGEAEGPVAVSADRASGEVGFIRARHDGGDLLQILGESSAAAVSKASTYLDEYGAAFGARDGQLSQTGVQSYRYGWIVRFRQTYQGLPVFGAEQLKANIDREGDLTAVSGFAAPDLNLSTTPRFSQEQAAERAVATVRTSPRPVPTAGTATWPASVPSTRS